jgi:hypothetical protein
MQGFKHYFFDGVAELERKTEVAVIRVCPVMARAHGKCHRDLRHFMPRTPDVEEDFPLPQENQDLQVYEARGKRIGVRTDDLMCRQVCQGVRGRLPGVFHVLTLRPRFGFGRQRSVSRSYGVKEELRC